MKDSTVYPSHWAVKKLGDVIDIQGGSQPPKSEFIYEPIDGYVQLLQIRDFGENPVPTYVQRDRVTKFCKNNDILIARYGASLGRIVTGLEGAYNVALAKTIYDREIFDDVFVFYLLKTPIFQTPLKMISRSAQNGFAKHDIANIHIPVPPIEEQKRIVAKIEELFSELDKGIESLKTAREQLKTYRQALLKHAFEGKLTEQWRKEKNLVDEWEITDLGKCGKWQGGGTPSKSKPEYWEEGDILWVTPKDMKQRIICDTQQKITKLGVDGSSAKYTSGKAILFVVRSGILRRVLPVAISPETVTVNQDMQSLVPNKNLVDFLYWYCEANEREIREKCSKDGTTVESIDVAALKRFPAPIPTLDEQKKIVRIIEEKISVLDVLQETLGNQLKKSENLRQSILKKAFSGQLVPQAPNDEPASELLARIQAEKAAQKTAVKPKTESGFSSRRGDKFRVTS